jgi:hypothetical protein
MVIDDPVRRPNVTIASTVSREDCRVESLHRMLLLHAVSIPGQAYELANVTAVEPGFPMEDPRGGLELGAAVLRGRFVCGPDRVARFGGDLFAVHEERRHRQAHVSGLSPSDAPGRDVVAA